MKRLLLAMVLGCGMLAGCGQEKNPTTPTPPAPLPSPTVTQSVTLAPGEAITLDWYLYLKFREVVRDSRCPAAATCITAGEAVLAFDVGAYDGPPAKPYELKSDGSGKTLTFGNWIIEVDTVSPYPITFDSIPKADYRAKLRVSH